MPLTDRSLLVCGLVVSLLTLALGVDPRCAGEGACSSCVTQFSQIAASSSRYTMSPGTERQVQLSAQWASTLVRIGALSSRWTCTPLGLDCSAEVTMKVTNPAASPEQLLEVGSTTNCFDRSAALSGAGTYVLVLTCHNSLFDCVFDLKIQASQRAASPAMLGAESVVDLRATQLLSPVEDQVRAAYRSGRSPVHRP